MVAINQLPIQLYAKKVGNNLKKLLPTFITNTDYFVLLLRKISSTMPNSLASSEVIQ